MVTKLLGTSSGPPMLSKKVDPEDNVEDVREGLGQAVTVIAPFFEFLIFPTDRYWGPQLNQIVRKSHRSQ